MSVMGDYFKIDKKFRNFGLGLILIAILILIVWMVFYLEDTEDNYNFRLLSFLGIGLLLGGILIVTRIQFVIWAEKRYQNEKN